MYKVGQNKFNKYKVGQFKFNKYKVGQRLQINTKWVIINKMGQINSTSTRWVNINSTNTGWRRKKTSQYKWAK